MACLEVDHLHLWSIGAASQSVFRIRIIWPDLDPDQIQDPLQETLIRIRVAKKIVIN